MESKEKNWVVFYSKEDMATGYSLQKAEDILINLDIEKELGINDLLELYNIKLYFDNDLYLISWGTELKETFKTTLNKSWNKIKDFWLLLTNENIINHIESVDIRYIKSFWKLINYFQIYKKINKKSFLIILEEFPFHVHHVLELKQIVDHFGHELRFFLMNYDKSTELLLSNLEIQYTHNSPIYYFPNCLSLLDKEAIISKYIERANVNLNYVRLIEHSKDSDSLRLSPRVRLSAKKKSKQLNKQLFEESHSIDMSVQITLNIDQDEPFTISTENQTTQISYSEKYINERESDINLFFLFKALFLFTNSHGVIDLVSKESESNIIEKISLKSKNEYLDNIMFNRKNTIAHMQILLLNHYLNRRNKSVEKLIESFIKDIIIRDYNISSFIFRFPSEQSTYLEKIRILAPELDFLIKQYQSYVNERKIDFELISLDSTPLRLSDIKSLVVKKYVYINNEEINRLKYHFFSDQSTLFYIEPYKDKYSNLYELLVYENVSVNNFEDYQLPTINHLTNLGYLRIDEDDYVRIVRDIFMYVVKELNEDAVLSYWYYPAPVRTTINEMVNEGLLRFENTLFTKTELNYFNYYLNKKEFTNGLDLRNKYLHGTNEISERVNEYEYYVLIKLIILIVIKIEDDLKLYKHINQQEHLSQDNIQ